MRPVLSRTLMAVAGAVGALGSCDLAGQEAVRNYAVPFRIENTMVRSTLAIEVKERPVGMTYEAFTRAVSDPVDGALVRLFDSLQSGVLDDVLPLIPVRPFEEPGTREGMAQGYIEGFRDVWPTLRILKRMDWGREQAFVWEVQMNGTPFRRIFRLASDAMMDRDGYWLDEMNPQGPVAVKNVLADIEQMEAMGEGMAYPEAEDLRFRTPIQDLEMAWRFDGFACDFDAFNRGATVPDHPVARFFHRASLALADGDPAAYGAFYGSWSQAKLRSWMNGEAPDDYRSLVESLVTEGRRVTFILTAPPVYLVYFETVDGRHPYRIVWDSGDGLRLVNFYSGGLVDDILKDEMFFYRPVIAPLAGKVEMPPGAGEDSGEPSEPRGNQPEPSPRSGTGGAGGAVSGGTDPGDAGAGSGEGVAGNSGKLRPLWTVLLAVLAGIGIGLFLRGRR